MDQRWNAEAVHARGRRLHAYRNQGPDRIRGGQTAHIHRKRRPGVHRRRAAKRPHHTCGGPHRHHHGACAQSLVRLELWGPSGESHLPFAAQCQEADRQAVHGRGGRFQFVDAYVDRSAPIRRERRTLQLHRGRGNHAKAQGWLLPSVDHQATVSGRRRIHSAERA